MLRLYIAQADAHTNGHLLDTERRVQAHMQESWEAHFKKLGLYEARVKRNIPLSLPTSRTLLFLDETENTTAALSATFQRHIEQSMDRTQYGVLVVPPQAFLETVRSFASNKDISQPEGLVAVLETAISPDQLYSDEKKTPIFPQKTPFALSYTLTGWLS